MPTITHNGMRLHFLDEGRGSDCAVLLLHAFPLHSGMWEPQVAALGESWRVLAPDFRGLGKSEAVEDPAAYSVESYADDVRAVIEEAGVSSVVLVGLSMGGYVAFAFLKRHRPLVRALVLADTRASADGPEERQRRVTQQQRLAAGEVEAVTAAAIENIVGADASRRDEVVATARRLANANPASGLIGALEALKQRPDVTELLGAIDVPTLVLVGEQDTTTPVPVADAMCGAIPQADLKVLPDAGHLSSMENPEAFNAAVLEFVGRHGC